MNDSVHVPIFKNDATQKKLIKSGEVQDLSRLREKNAEDDQPVGFSLKAGHIVFIAILILFIGLAIASSYNAFSFIGSDPTEVYEKGLFAFDASPGEKWDYYIKHGERLDKKVECWGMTDYPMYFLLAAAGNDDHQAELVKFLDGNHPLGESDAIYLRCAVRSGLDKVTTKLLKMGFRDQEISDTVALLKRERNMHWKETITALHDAGVAIDEKSFTDLANREEEERKWKEKITELELLLVVYESKGEGDGPDARDIRDKIKSLKSGQ